MQTKLFTFLAETSVHPGAGQDEGAIDLPVSRERTTGYPFQPGSGLKGALRDAARGQWPDLPSGGQGAEQTSGDDPASTDAADDAGDGAAEPMRENGEDATTKCELSNEVKKLFGRSDDAGRLIVSDLRLLLLPVRCLTASYKWLTCPHLLERLERDLRRGLGQAPGWSVPAQPPKRSFFGAASGPLQLEERTFNRARDLPDGLVAALTALFPDGTAARRLAARLTIVCDDDFAWFARYGLPVQARNVLEAVTKRSTNLWFEEALPPDSLLYALISERTDEKSLDTLLELFQDRPYLQVGGNETVGQGWLQVAWQPKEAS